MNQQTKVLCKELEWLLVNRNTRIKNCENPEVFNRLYNMSISANQKRLVEDLESDIEVLKNRIEWKIDILKRKKKVKLSKDINMR